MMILFGTFYIGIFLKEWYPMYMSACPSNQTPQIHDSATITIRVY